jgi:hypothetical protein
MPPAISSGGSQLNWPGMLWRTISSVTTPPATASGPMTRAESSRASAIDAVAPTIAAVNGASSDT